ncbi:signal peptide peptidase SppA [Paraliomyxa miuraensis]|uniref:signal peptide peptidase SppA n=1 Tax=Paraliomyxa miuraensis TaxID=376150 RepID=UPI002250C9DB|nr:signal peptide peptidase SppA [Paraliomyxa miuraensis]MCX4242707.1 signal peptide peptidase SppA [Paraliomyxa miuraensis]
MMSKLLRIAVLASLAVGCKTPADDGAPQDSKQTPSEDGGSSEDEASPMGLPPMAKFFTAGLDKPGPYEEPRQSPDYEDGKPYHVVMELEGSIDELQSFDLLSGGGMGKPLHEITNALHESAADANVKGLVLRVNGLSLDMATAEELRRHLLAFKGDGARPVRCHTEGSGNASYYLLTACDELALSPLGDLEIPGPAATPVHVKGLLDKLGVQTDFLHIGAFKGAAEPLTREEPSPEMMQTLDAIVARSYDTMVAGMVEGRGVDEAAAKAAIDQGMVMGSRAVETKLADEVATWEAYLAKATGDVAWKKHKKKDDALADFGALQRFLGLLPPERPSGPHVAVVYAVGNVIDGKGNGTVGARQEIASRTLVATLRALARDENVKAVVMRVNSPGGSALASEQIWHAVEEVKAAGKPFVVSMGGVAASGGYYISCGADEIYANANTLTGSIGVVGGKMVLGPALESIGIKTYEVHRGQRALMGSPMTPWTDDERELVRGWMETIYEVFLGHVAAGRTMERDAVHEIAQGRVWTGVDAKERGLVDEIGGLQEAVAQARKLGGVDEDAALEVYPGEPTIRDLITSFGQVQAGGVSLGMRAAVEELAAVAGPETAHAVASLLQLTLDLRDAKVWAVSWVRPPR